MDIKVIPTDSFTKELKRLAKKHRSIFSDIASLSANLKENPTQGTELGQEDWLFQEQIKENQVVRELLPVSYLCVKLFFLQKYM